MGTSSSLQAAGFLEVSFALPYIQEDFGVTEADVQWVVASFILVWVSQSLQTGGRRGKRLGMRGASVWKIVRCPWQEEGICFRLFDICLLERFVCGHACKLSSGSTLVNMTAEPRKLERMPRVQGYLIVISASLFSVTHGNPCPSGTTKDLGIRGYRLW